MLSSTKGKIQLHAHAVGAALTDNYSTDRFQVSPTELEEIIGQHGNVADAAVTSVWDDTEATEIPRAFVVPKIKVFSSERNNLSQEIQCMVASKVSGYKKLRGGVFFVDQLPRNPTGKLLRRELRDLARLKAHI